MKSKTKPILAVAGYLWGGALLTLLVSLAVTMVYRAIAGGKNADEYLAVGLITLPVQLLFGFFAFSRYGYRNRELTGKEWTVSLLGGGGLHFLLCLPFHFSLYTAGVPTLYLGEYLYWINTPNLPPEMAFTEIPMLWPLFVFLAVEGLTLLCAYLGFSRGQKKRERESNALKSQASS